MNAAGTRTLVLLALLVLQNLVLVSASFFPRNRNRGFFSGYDYSRYFQLVECKGSRRVNFRVTYESQGSGRIGYHLIYGENITLICSTNNIPNLTIEDQINCVQTKQLNATTILLHLTPNVGEHRYICSDSETLCEESVIIHVAAMLSIVTSSRGYYSPKSSARFGPTAGYSSAFVPVGETYELHCSGNDEKSLIIKQKIYQNGGLDQPLLQTETVSNATVMFRARADNVGEKLYSCETKNYRRGQGMTVTIDYYPEAQNFQCIIYMWRRDIECSWTSSSKRNTFKLSYLEDKDTVVCIDNSGTKERVCSWNIYKSVFSVKHPTSLLLQSCNEFLCNNQTIVFDYTSIIQLGPPSGLTILNTSSHSAGVAWRCPDSVESWSFDFKVEFRLPSHPWQQRNTPSTSNFDCSRYEFQIKLPCPGAHYELRVYARFHKTHPHSVRLWSEPSASIFFFTNPLNSDDIVDQECIAEFEERESLPSPDAMLHKVRQLITFERREESIFKRKISASKQKLAIAKELLESLTESGTEDNA